VHDPIKGFLLQQARKKRKKQLLLCLAWWGAALAILAFTLGAVLSRFLHLLPYYILFLLFLVVFPLFWEGIFRSLFPHSFRGVVKKVYLSEGYVRDVSAVTSAAKPTNTTSPVAQLRMLVKTDACVVEVKTEGGFHRTFKLAGKELALVAKELYRIGDRVELYPHARVPISLNNRPSRPICICCGMLGKREEEICRECRCPYPARMLPRKRVSVTAAYLHAPHRFHIVKRISK